MTWIFAGFFLAVSLLLVCVMAYQFGMAVVGGSGLVAALLQTVSTAVVALAIFELAVGISREYSAEREEGNVYSNVRRTTTRFFGSVCISLVLEALFLVIKYSQLDLAGNLYYPVAIIVGASVLMISLGLFLALTRREGAVARRGPGGGAAKSDGRPEAARLS